MTHDPDQPSTYALKRMGRGTPYIKQDIEGKTVLDAARERIAQVFDTFDTPVVSFSGGKDSTVVLNLSYEAAQARGKPLHVFLCDEEIIDPDTLAYWERTREREGIIFHWVCVPVRHTLRSETRSCWYTWDPAARDVWFREVPPWAITEIPGFVQGKHHIAEAIHGRFAAEEYGTVCSLSGVRTAEAFNRRRAIIFAGSFLTSESKRFAYAKPIYDWKTEDVWWAIKHFGWDYSRLYDKKQRYGESLQAQRIGPWGNVAAIRESNQWAEFYPEAWERAIRRLPELKAQARYGRSKLFLKNYGKPLGMTWQEWTWQIIASYDDEESRKRLTKLVTSTLKRWERSHTVPFPEEALTVTGPGGEKERRCWRWLASVCAKNDSMGGGSRDSL